ncbi:DNA repair and recombination protein RadB [Methanoplanus endosymbiosus]|uniref:DNA repair and recombination protein RadB n=1 Tax=Methanoplanus endosymbiosus TaxID=33865 RepID=A0A9E7PU03_9EURY|nr:DNA repair and recombination protein RadB [Methanoplanus endosymbiosus]UUX93922.1 DNA repair and recombination protein RadB [Methanoplanus endosymbiosus]
MNISKIHTGADELDELIGGGLENRVITQYYGEPAGGKSTFCLMSAVSVLRSGKSVIYIDSEGFSAERFKQIAGDNAKELASNLILFEPCDFREQSIMIDQCREILERKNTGLIVLDSITALYRVNAASSGDVQRQLSQQLIKLLAYSRKYDIPVIVTNQVYTDIDTDRLSGLGGTSLRHISKVIIRIERDKNFRRAVLEKHRSKPEGEYFRFEITEKGIKRISNP